MLAWLQVLAEVLGAEAAVGRIQFVSGTHAIATALYSVLRPGDELLAVAGRWATSCRKGLALLICIFLYVCILHNKCVYLYNYKLICLYIIML